MTSTAILTTHVGSLPRPDRLRALLVGGAGDGSDAFEAAVREAVHEVVHQQLVIGIDLLGDGEMSKPGSVSYALDRLTGIDGEPTRLIVSDVEEHPQWAARRGDSPWLGTIGARRCHRRIGYLGEAAVARDIANLRDALDGSIPPGAFLTAASPGLVETFFPRGPECPYPSDDAYLEALAEALRVEYEAIASAGLVLQIDAPELAMGHHVRRADGGSAGFLDRAARQVEALDHALRRIAPEQVRMHVCWGNYDGPHHHDVELRQIVGLLVKARPAAISFAAANPRHQHEWAVWREVALPPEKILIPGVIDPTTSFVEHPDLVAERVAIFARSVGPERVVAGTDCGFASIAETSSVAPSIAWAKLRSLVSGAERAARLL